MPATTTVDAITSCRACGNTDLVPVLHLGIQTLTGVFPKSKDAAITRGPLSLVKCHGEPERVCGLLQLAHSYPQSEMYGDNYGYRSSLNRSMVEHLHRKIAALDALQPLEAGSVVLDIGSNDGTTLSAYSPDLVRVGVDPTAGRFADRYPPGALVVPELFSPEAFLRASGGRKASRITSLAMFYDLPAPQAFVEGVASILADDGLWHLEQAYLPAMLENLTYDTVCHEHLEYYGLAQIRWLMQHAGLTVVDAEANLVNGGSFAVTVAKTPRAPSERLLRLQAQEDSLALHSLAPYQAFAHRVEAHRQALRETMDKLKHAQARVLGLGASTKGNVLLQYCNISNQDLAAIGDVNPDKYGCYTPGTHIPIVSDEEARAMKPDVFLVLPWHFRQGMVAREAAFLQRGGRLLFPLPRIELVSA